MTTMKSNGTYQVLITWSAPAPIGVDLNPQRYTVFLGEYKSMAAAQRRADKYNTSANRAGAAIVREPK